ncbi:hypothetical protein ACIB24_22245 [Spongisporangium articulatum]|uniref:DUF1214 domain-containing protein n=1 Tax=Spongisporangium articulatum TaxID=3362603 RepID=A0ABW8ATS7_9ACTN
MDDLSRPLAEAITEAEKLIATADVIRTEQDRLEGYDYLAGRIRAALQLAFDRDPARPVLINSTHQYARQGLDNPDALYFHAYIDDEHEWVVRGVRGSTADLSFQVMSGGYSADGTPESLAAFDDRALDIAADGSFALHLAPAPAGAKTLIIREVFNDWETERRGTLWIERPDLLGRPAVPPDARRTARRYEVAAQLLVGSVRTWLAFPHFFQNREPVNTLTTPRSTPGGLASQFSSIGHYALAEDEALVVTVPECSDCSYQGIQIGSDWYVSTDYESHQTSLTKAQAVTDPDGLMRFVVSERDPGIANWLETTGHRTGPMMLRWQRLTRDLGREDGPQVQVLKLDDVRSALPFFAPRAEGEYADRIAARQRAVARRMLS